MQNYLPKLIRSVGVEFFTLFQFITFLMECTQREPLAQWRNKVNLFLYFSATTKKRKNIVKIKPGTNCCSGAWYSNGTFDSLFVRVTITMSNLYTHSTHESDTIRCVQHTHGPWTRHIQHTHIDPGCVCVCCLRRSSLLLPLLKDWGWRGIYYTSCDKSRKFFSFLCTTETTQKKRKEKNETGPHFVYMADIRYGGRWRIK